MAIVSPTSIQRFLLPIQHLTTFLSPHTTHVDLKGIRTTRMLNCAHWKAGAYSLSKAKIIYNALATHSSLFAPASTHQEMVQNSGYRNLTSSWSMSYHDWSNCQRVIWNSTNSVITTIKILIYHLPIVLFPLAEIKIVNMLVYNLTDFFLWIFI